MRATTGLAVLALVLACERDQPALPAEEVREDRLDARAHKREHVTKAEAELAELGSRADQLEAAAGAGDARLGLVEQHLSGIAFARAGAERALERLRDAAPAGPALERAQAEVRDHLLRLRSSTAGLASVLDTTRALADQDRSIATEIRSRLERDHAVADEAITVWSSFGVAHLEGQVTSYRARDRAGEIARSVAGVDFVQNGLEVRTAATPPRTRRR